jgi:hypothetical protein
VAGRGGVPSDAKAVAVSLTAVEPAFDGYLTAFPCGGAPPNASSVNFTAGSVTPNAAVVQVGVSGSICVLSNTDTDLVVDVTGYDARWTVARTFEPQRILDTRPGFTTADQQAAGEGRRPGDAVLELAVSGRLGIPAGIRAVVLNVTVTEPESDGFVTVYPCGGARPATSSLNYAKGQTVSNLVVVGASAEGRVCVYTQRPTQVVVDLSGYHT